MYCQWKQYEVTKGLAKWQGCGHLLKGITWTSTEQAKKEANEQFSAQRKKDAAQAAGQIFARIALQNTVDETKLILKHCTFAYKTKGPPGVQVSMRKCHFEDMPSSSWGT